MIQLECVTVGVAANGPESRPDPFAIVAHRIDWHDSIPMSLSVTIIMWANSATVVLRYVYVCVHTSYSTVHTQAALCSWDIAEVQSTKTTFNSDCVYDSRHPVVPMSRTVAVYGVG